MPKHKSGRPIQQKVSMCIFRVNGVECSLWNRNCKACGWNPEVEEDRQKKMKSGEADLYLKIDLAALHSKKVRNARDFDREEHLC